jgi:two-component system cell cycle sensor histidine kinase/response regulator CckA
MNKTLRVLNVEDSERDAALVRRHLALAGYDVIAERVDTQAAMKAALKERHWDLILSDYTMPNFSALDALAVLEESGLDIPTIIISGTVGEELAVQAMLAGAHDYLMKDNLVRLGASIERELHVADSRRAHRQAEEALKASEAELRALFAAMTDLIIVLDAEGRHLKIAPSRPIHSYLTAAERIGKTLHELFSKEKADFFLEHVRRALKEKQMHRVEYSLPIEGEDRWFEGSVSPMTEDTVIWIARDISEHKRSEEALKETVRSKEESLALLDTILASAPIGFALYNRNLELERINDKLAAINGLPVKQHLGGSLSQVLPEMAPVLEPLLKRVLETGEPVIDLELCGETTVNSGDRQFWLVSFYPVRMQGGEILGVGLLVSEITDRKRAEEALRESEERYRDLVENAHDIIYSHDLAGHYTSINKAGETITGYTVDEVLELNLAQTVAPEYLPRAKEMLKRKLAGECVTAYEMEIIAKDGRRITVEANTKLVYQNGSPIGVQGIARNITKRKQLEEQLRQSQKMEAIGQLAGGVAHDFNNLLTAINGYCSLALQSLDEGNPIKSYLEEVKKAGDRATNLTRQLLAFGRKQILQPLALNLNDVISDMNKMLRRLIGEDIHFTAKLDPDAGKVLADPGQIEQVLVNLIVNARDAMPQGGTLTLETTDVEFDSGYLSGHVGVQTGNYVMLAVSDTGTGMDEETRQRIFEPFFTTKEKGKGTGLGLSTVYGIVKQSGGNIWVYSEPGKGSTFKVYLPRVESKADQLKENIADTVVVGGSETVLLVEDEDVVRGLARRILEQAGYSVVEAGRAAEALGFCEEHIGEIDLLLTDVVMPGMSGKELADHLQLQRPDLKLLFMSGYTDEAIGNHGILDSSVQLIQKPFTASGLTKKVRDVLDLNGKAG